MKKRILTLMLLLLTITFAVKANPVDMATIREVAMKFMNTNAKTPLRYVDDLQLVTTYSIDRGDAAFHIFNTPNGFVIVAADDCATPILGYSDEGQFDVQNIPIQLQDYLQGFVEQIEYSIENHLETDEKTIRQWELVRHTGRLTENRDGEAVEPLIAALWDQKCYYNAMCPEDENGWCGRCVTGCVATAMGMILHYWGYPAQGSGSHTYTPDGYPEQSVNFGETIYDWANMPNQLAETSTQAEIDAVSTLLWHCGVAVNMGYGAYASGALLDVDALIDYFNYADDMHLEHRQNDELWVSLLKTDLDFGRPVLYVGDDYSGAHAFVCDGYDANDRFHFNWGWSGSQNGYFALQASIYYHGNYAVFNIHPNAGVTRQVTASTNPYDGGTVTGAGTYDIGNTCTLTAMANEDYTFMYWTEDDEVVSCLAEYSFSVRNDRDLVAHFALPYHIEVTSVPMGGGTVSGVGEYNYGCTCTLTATANEGYEFIGWRRANGSVASTAATYSFTVTESTALTAVFAALGGEQIVFADLNVKALCVANWDTDGNGELSYAEAATVTGLGKVFYYKSSITSFNELQYFTGLTSIGNSAFSGCSGLISIEIPNSVASIGSNAFSGCRELISIEIPNSVTSIGSSAFSGCNGLISIEIPNSVTSIGYYAFKNCIGLTSIEIPNSVISIGSYTFEGCTSLTSIELSNSLTSIGYYVFRNCISLTSIEIPNSVTSIGNYAFDYCTSLTSVEIPNSVTSIGNYAFGDCRGLTSIEIPNSVTSIGNYAFYCCTGLTSMTVLAETPPTLGGNYVFVNVKKNIPVYVPCGSMEAYQNVGGWNEFTNMIGLCSGEVMVRVNPSEGGTVTGAGYYNGGDLCILTATPNPGYSFVNWIENGRVISTDTVYSFRARPATIAANFCPNGNIVFADANVKALCVANWDTNGDGELSYAEAVAVTSLGEVFIDQSSITSFDELQYFIGLTSIGSVAFNNCSGLTSIGIPNSVTSIGFYAFYGCRCLASMTVLAETPPTLDIHVFYNVNKSILVCVPCGSLETYQNAVGWNEFTNMIGLCSGEVMVRVNPSEGGVVTGAGYYNGGDLCVLTATPNPGFSFINWIENGVVVSTDMVYSFHAHPATVIANFCPNGNIVFADANVKALCVANWDTNGDGELSYVEAAAVTSLGEVFHDQSSITSFDELQYFLGLTSIGNYAFLWCTGMTSIEIPNSVASISNYAFYYCTGLTSIEIPIFVTNIGINPFYGCSGLEQIVIEAGNTAYDSRCNCNAVIKTSTNELAVGCKNTVIPNSVVSIGSLAFYGCTGLTSIEIPNFVTSIGDYAFGSCSRLTSIAVFADDPPTVGNYAFSGVNKSIPVLVPCGSLAAYQSAAYWNEFTNIQENCSQQTVMLSEGWNWISLYVELGDPIEALQMLEAALGDNAMSINASEMYTEYFGSGFWIGDLDEVGITNEQMYMVEVVNDCEIELEGTVANPADYTITINPGWNWIGFPCGHELSLEEAFADFEAEDGDQLAEAELYTEYGFGVWIGDIETLVPGRGYMYFSNSDESKILVFQTGAKAKTDASSGKHRE